MGKFMQNKDWINGSAFLLRPESEGPKQVDKEDLMPEEDPEIKTCARVIKTSTQERYNTINKLIAYYSCND